MGGYHLSITCYHYFRKVPLVNKPWFMNPGAAPRKTSSSSSDKSNPKSRRTLGMDLQYKEPSEGEHVQDSQYKIVVLLISIDSAKYGAKYGFITTKIVKTKDIQIQMSFAAFTTPKEDFLGDVRSATCPRNSCVTRQLFAGLPRRNGLGLDG